MINQFYIDYIKAIENPDRVGWNGKVWTAPQYKGYDKNQRGYGIDIVKNDSAKRLTQNRPGQWLTEGEADKLMREHLLYVYGAAQKHIEGFDNLSDRRKAALLGMLYRGDSVNKNRHIININEPDDNKFFESISNYYKSKGLNERARNSSKFFSNNQLTNFLIPIKWEQWEPPMKFKSGGQIRKMQTASGGPIRRIKFTPEQIAKFERQFISVPGMNNSGISTYRTQGVQALQHLEREALRREEEIKSRMEMRPTLKRKATTAEKLRGKKDEYELRPLVVGMSGRDPLLGTLFDLYVGGKGLEAAGKLGLWGAAKYAPGTLLGNWGRGYFIGNEMKLVNPLEQTARLGITLRAMTPKVPDESSTSLKFFERPSKISESESLGFGRSRGFNPESGNDLHEFYTLLDRRQTMLDALRKLKAPEDMGVDETISKNSGSIIEDGYLMSNGYRYIPVTEKHFSTGANMSFGRLGVGGGGHNYGLNLGGQSTRVRDLGKESEIAYSRPGANLDRNDPLNLDIVVTTSDVEANKKGIQLLTKGMRDMESGAEFSGDASSTTAAEALSSWLRLARNKPQLRETAMSNAKIALDNNAGISLGKHTVTDPMHGIITENATMSPDAYSYLYRTAANNPDKFHLGYTMKAGNFNSFARNPKNAYMYDVEQNYLDGLITPQEYVELFNSWSLPLGGRRAYLYNGRVYKPQPFLIRNKQGGKMNILEFLKNGSGIHIKKKNRGKFTSYCGGKVTNECILKGKNSSNPAIRKRATFALNSRHWSKHKNGGLIIQLFKMRRLLSNLIK